MNYKSRMLDHYKHVIKEYDKILTDVDAGGYNIWGTAGDIEQCMVEAIESCLQGIKKLETNNEQIN